MNGALSAGLGIRGLRVGHWTGAGTGVTAVLAPPGTVGSAEVRGGAPATRETDLLDLSKTITRVDAVVLCGGSAFGLRAADGVMDHLAARGQGFPTTAGPVPIVPAAAVFDLVESNREIPTAANGRAAAESAEGATHLELGRVGAGRGATVGKWKGGEHAVPGGLGAAGAGVDSHQVAALAVVNAFGDVVDTHGQVIAGSTAAADSVEFPEPEPFSAREHTTLVVVVTDARLDKVECRLVAEAAHDGLARSLSPAHTRADGDLVFTLATGDGSPVSIDRLRQTAAEVTADAIRATAAAPS